MSNSEAVQDQKYDNQNINFILVGIRLKFEECKNFEFLIENVTPSYSFGVVNKNILKIAQNLRQSDKSEKIHRWNSASIYT